VGGDRVDCTEDRLCAADAAGLGQAGRGGCRRLRRASARPRRKRIKDLEREVKELRRANEILKLASAFFAQAELDRRLK
jgi:transposase-like protein